MQNTEVVAMFVSMCRAVVHRQKWCAKSCVRINASDLMTATYLVVSGDCLQKAEIVIAVKFEEILLLSWYWPEALQVTARTQW